ncbi:MAG: DUF2029 domain-containing protein [Candidatus Cloacimonetes bacterium]|nr:DUF2029 domain-containing protein [Candidatus Cloacimonadota bacterium]MCF7869368.1 DUF2029 domain-containing protein [Candidatus Cloacimonadota bacterium]
MKRNEYELLLNLLLIFAVFLSITGFFTDISNTAKFGGVDLRNRVVGARLLTRDLDPYHYKWQKGESQLLLDPRDNPNWNVNRVTVPPTVLILHSALSWLDYKTQRYLWLFIQWILFLGSLFLFSLSSSSKVNSKLIWICGLFFVGTSFYWRLHVERGQIYILYTFLIALSYWVYHQRKWGNLILSGFIIGITSLLRPPVILINLPFLIKKRWKFVLGNIMGVIVSFLSTLLILPFNTWLNYFSAMKVHGLIHTTELESAIGQYPFENIEGITNLWIVPNIPITDTSIQGLMLNLFGVVIPAEILWIILLLIICFCIYLLHLIRSKSFTILFLVGSILIFISEIFIPAARYTYNNVLILIPLCLLIIDSKKFLVVSDD